MPYWEKQYKVSFPTLGVSYDDLRIAFTVTKDLTEQTNKAEVTIYNLKDESRKKIEVADLKCEIYAGYKHNGGAVRVFTGTVTEANSTNNGTDIITKLKLSDGQTAIRDSVFSLSFPPKTSGKTILQSIANNMGIPIVFGKNVTIGTYTNGYSFVGGSNEALNEVCSSFGVNWSVQSDILQIILQDGVTGKQGQVFGTDSGLIGSPERVIKSAYKENKETAKKERKEKAGKEKYQKKAGWKIKTLLSPTINAGDSLKVESKSVKGWFKVEKVTHKGDSHNNLWESEFDLIDTKEADSSAE